MSIRRKIKTKINLIVLNYRRYKFRDTYDKIRCFLGIHDQVTITSANCKAKRASVITGLVQTVHAVTYLKRCRRCGKASAWISDGVDMNSVSVDFVIRQSESLFVAYCNAGGTFTRG